ncbi:MAG: flagellin FliC3 [Lachnospiraceae bacterium]|mgnify:FL=1|jgi:flagellin|nr:flagellin FliC3 [Lachnospiraceae bacterium]MCI9255439.1 flagellin FliC3 [Lachnospiraceae bacterium]
MKISYNAAAMRANYALNKSDKRLTTSLKRLSSGLKVTAAKENPSGYAIGRRMNAQIGGISVATQNSNNGISIIETADGALTEVHDMLQRMNELAVKGATGTLTSVDRETLNKELKQLKEEVARVANDTEFNGQALLDGSFEMRGYTNSQVAKVDYYTDEVLAKEYTISQLEVFYNDEGEIDLDQTKASFGLQAGDGFPEDAEVATVGQDKVTIKGGQGFELTIQVKPPTAFPGSVDCSGIVLDITGIGAMDTQIGANEGQQLAIRIPTISLNRLGIEQTEVTTKESSSDAITEVKGAIKYVSDVRSRLGAYQNRLEHTISSLDISKENMTASYSRIMDVDMAEEMTNYTTEQVISQASVSMVAQANERPSQVLQLLQ